MVNVKYNNKMYPFAMNGQTGKIVGNIPVGVKETILWSIINNRKKVPKKISR